MPPCPRDLLLPVPVAILALAILAGGCSHSEEPPARLIATVNVGDLDTGVAPELGFKLRLLSYPLGFNAAAFRTLFRLVSLGDGAELAIDVDQEKPTLITVTPKAPLGEGWYRLELPQGRYVIPFSDVLIADGVPRVRFFTGPAPTLRLIRFCQEGEGRPERVEVEFSEEMDPAGLSTLSLRTGSTACTLVEAAHELASFDCPARGEPAVWSVAIGDSLASTAGVPWRMLDGRTSLAAEIAEEALEPGSGGCLEWKRQYC